MRADSIIAYVGAIFTHRCQCYDHWHDGREAGPLVGRALDVLYWLGPQHSRCGPFHLCDANFFLLGIHISWHDSLRCGLRASTAVFLHPLMY